MTLRQRIGLDDPNGRARLIVVSGGVLAAAAMALSVTTIVVVDDAYISYRYASNLARNGELVFNVGERVEGITNLLWTLLLTPAVQAGLAIEVVAVVVSIALVALVCLRLVALAPHLGAGFGADGVGAALLILSPSFITTATNGLESALFAAALTELVYRFSKGEYVGAFVAAGVLGLTRPEGFFMGFMVAAVMLFGRRTRRPARIGIAVLLAFIMAVTVFRWLYYGQLLPNSVLAKSFPPAMLASMLGSIIDYFTGFGLANTSLVIVAGASALSLIKKRGERAFNIRTTLICLGGILFSYAVTLRNGGDWMPGYRLLMQYGPLYSVLLIDLVGKREMRSIVALALLLPGMIQLSQAAIGKGRPDFVIRSHGDSFYGEATSRLAGPLLSDDIVSAEAIGYLAYELPEIYVHDPLGLTDEYLAKHGDPAVPYGRRDVDYSMGQVKPEVAVWHSSGHLRYVSQALIDAYTIYCANQCDVWGADIVMVRNDRNADIGAAFADWKQITIRSDRPG